MDYSLPGFSFHGIVQVRILEWVAISFSRGSSLPRDWIPVSCIASGFFTCWAVREAYYYHLLYEDIPLFSQFSSFQSLSRVQLFAIPWTAAHLASLSITNSRSLRKLMSIKSVIPSNHFILCHPLLPPSIFPSIRVYSNKSVLRNRWPTYWSFSFSMNIQLQWIFRTDLL